MRPADDIHKMIKKMHVKASAKLDRRVHDDISISLTESALVEPNIRRSITKGGAARLAVAAAILIAFGIGFSIGRWSGTAQLESHTPDVTGYASTLTVYPTAPKAEDSFWRSKAIAAMRPRTYAQSQTIKTSLLNAYKQYLKEKHYD